MATASIIELTDDPGDWGSYGTAGHYVIDDPADIVSLPAWIDSVTIGVSTTIARNEDALAPASDPRYLARDAAATTRTRRMLYANDGTGTGWTEFAVTPSSGAAPYILSMRLYNNTSDREATCSILASDGATLLAGPTTAVDMRVGRWFRVLCSGPVRIRTTGVYPVTQGLLLDAAGPTVPPARLCALDGRPGLAL